MFRWLVWNLKKVKNIFQFFIIGHRMHLLEHVENNGLHTFVFPHLMWKHFATCCKTILHPNKDITNLFSFFAC
jgi:hypothetical protein